MHPKPTPAPRGFVKKLNAMKQSQQSKQEQTIKALKLYSVCSTFLCSLASVFYFSLLLSFYNLEDDFAILQFKSEEVEMVLSKELFDKNKEIDRLKEIIKKQDTPASRAREQVVYAF
jgi:hypothetical protein